MARLFNNSQFFTITLVILIFTVISKINGYPYDVPTESRKERWREQSRRDGIRGDDSVGSLLENGPDGPKGSEVSEEETVEYSRASFNNDGPAVKYDKSREDDYVETYEFRPKIDDEGRKNNKAGEGIHRTERISDGWEDAGESSGINGNNNEYGVVTRAVGDENVNKDEKIVARKGENNNKDNISRVIEQALQDGLFLTPLQWAESVADQPFNVQADEGMSVKIQKARSPGLSSSGPKQSGQGNSSDEFIFPDHPSNNPRENDVINRPVPTCKGSTFCVDVPYYPHKEVAEALQRRYLSPVTEPVVISQRFGPADEDNGFCGFQIKTIEPRSGLDANNEWRYIMNDEPYKQTVRIEVCEAQDEPCRIIGPQILYGYETSCRQKFVYRQMVALGPSGTQSVPFQMPSSCCCHIKFVGDPVTRMGIDINKNKQTPAATSVGNTD